ncbi:hypothetical protein OIU78_022940 [Salix suchowensis]|nr:hypothetical protein OIU78_022940 [Salix suchowensis]
MRKLLKQMSTVKDGRKKAMEPAVISWKQKKDVADEEEEALVKDIEDLRSWTEMIDAMNDEQLKEYLKNRPEEVEDSEDPKEQAQTKSSTVQEG